VGGNIELERSTRMVDEFAVIILFSIDGSQNSIDEVSEQLAALRRDDCFVNVHKAVSKGGEAGRKDTKQVELIASGADQPGIVDAVTLALYKEHINIEALDFDTESAPMTGEHLFRMTARLAIPGTVDMERLRSGLRHLEDALNFDILMRPAVD
jgi:glycine cleavage system regulatory protein